MGYFLLDPGVLPYLPILFATISVIVISLSWLIANIFENDMLKTKVKGWIVDLILVFFVFIFLNPLFGSPFNITPTSTGSTLKLESTYTNPTLTVLSGKTMGDITTDFSDFYTEQSVFYLDVSAIFQHYITIISQYGMSGGVPGWYFAFNFYLGPYKGVSVLSGPSSMILSTVINIIFISQFIITFLRYFVPLGPLLFLIGISIRFLPSAKSIGNIILALAIGLYILFPLSVAFVNAFNAGLQKSNAVPDLTQKNVYNLALSMRPSFKVIPTPIIDTFCSDSKGASTFRLLTNGPLGELIQGSILCIPAAIVGAFYVCFKIFSSIIFPIETLVIALAGIISMLPSLIQAATPFDVGPMLTFLYTFAYVVIYRYVLIIIETIFIGIFTIVGAKSVLSSLGSAPELYSFSKLV